ncbi:MAG: TonB family protein [Myxococcales bacterium]|nr:TonB family protein [Myxococcales bacterium]
MKNTTFGLALALCLCLAPGCSSKKKTAAEAGAASASGTSASTTAATTKKGEPVLCGSTIACRQKGLCVPKGGRCVADDGSCRKSEVCKYLAFCSADMGRCARFGLPVCRKGADAYCKRSCGDSCSCRSGTCTTNTTLPKQITFPETISRAAIKQVMGLHRGATRGCYERRLLRQPTLGGRVRVEFVISADGSTQDVKVGHSTFSDNSLAECVLRAVRAMRFPKPDKEQTIRYPFVFSAPGLIGKMRILVGGKPKLTVDARGVVRQGETKLYRLMVAEKEIWGRRGKIKLTAEGKVIGTDGKARAGTVNDKGELSLGGKTLVIGDDGKLSGGDKKAPAVVIEGAKDVLHKRAAMLLYVHNVLSK